MVTKRSYNIQIWVGLREAYTENLYTIADIRKVCDDWVNSIKDCVTITPTEFRYVAGSEPGVVIGYIQYPRFPRRRREMRKRALKLAEMLMLELNQNRVTITTPYRSYMLENK